jgi:hypothetical protein
MENNSPARPRWLWIGIVLFVLTAIGLSLYFAGRYLYNLGRQAAAQIAGVEETATAFASPTVTATITITPTLTPSPTPTPFFPPTATATKVPWTSCPGIVVQVTDTEKGEMVHVLRCEDSLQYDLGPLPKGVFAVSPDDEYIVYAAQDGVIYAARIGATSLTVIRKTAREFYTFGQDMAPIYKLTFTGESPYVLEVYEARYGQNLPIRMPGWLTD